MAPLAALAAAAWGLGALPGVAAQVNCGAHVARSCDYCPGGQGQNWCNGQCRWVRGPLGGACVAQELAPGGEGGWLGVPWLLSGCVMLGFAYFYKAKVVDELPVLPPWGGRPARAAAPERGLLACVWSPDTCLHTAFCLPVVAAKNYRSAEVCPFWPACLLMFLGTYSPLYCFTAALRTTLSMRVKDRLGYPSSCLQDFLVSLFCFPCEVGRESLEVDDELGVEVACCCRLEWLHRGPRTPLRGDGGGGAEPGPAKPRHFLPLGPGASEAAGRRRE